jgi:hypothetical protein
MMSAAIRGNVVRYLSLIATAAVLFLPETVDAARLNDENVQNIIPQQLATFAKTRGAVAIELDAGTAKRELDIKHKAEEYLAALSASLMKSGAFSRVTDRDNADYLLEVVVTSVGMAGVAKIEMDLNTTWRLTDLKVQRAVWADVVGSNFLTTAREAFAGAKRVRLTQEGVFRENIRLGLEQLARAELEQ